MDFQQVIQNLKKTIAAKEVFLAEQRVALAMSHIGPTPLIGSELACVATIKFLEINIDELNNILVDVEKSLANLSKV